MFDNFPWGLALLELDDPQDVSSWRLAGINSRASSLVVPSIETFLSSKSLGLAPFADLRGLYREVIAKQRTKTVGMVEAPVRGPNNERLYTVSAFPVGKRGVGILFEDAGDQSGDDKAGKHVSRGATSRAADAEFGNSGEMRTGSTVSYQLYPPLLDELGLLAALRWLTAGFAERSSIEVNLNAPREFSRLPDAMELTLFRIVQESLTNVQGIPGARPPGSAFPSTRTGRKSRSATAAPAYLRR